MIASFVTFIFELINFVIKEYGRIDGWVNNAYPRTDDWGSRFENIKIDSWKSNIDMQLNSVFVFCQKVLPYMAAKQNGSIVNITADGTGSMTARYSFDSASCKRDMREYVLAIAYDLGYTGNYKSLRAAKTYRRAQQGSIAENMFFLRNATTMQHDMARFNWNIKCSQCLWN